MESVWRSRETASARRSNGAEGAYCETIEGGRRRAGSGLYSRTLRGKIASSFLPQFVLCLSTF